jgi:outer membrane immunogenic protein
MKSIIIGITFVAFLGGSAIAADLPMKAPVAPAPVAAFSWTGFYVGLNAGGDWGNSDPTTTVAHIGDYLGTCGTVCSDTVNAAGRQRLNTNGFTGGIHGGYNWQFNNIVVGIEADFEYFRSAGSTSVTLVAFGTYSETIHSSVSTDWLFTLRPRLGLAVGNWLLYGTGGLAVTKLKANWGYSDSNTAGGRENASASETKTGWVAGGGIEAALPGNWVIGGEYLYVHFGSVSSSGNIIYVSNDDVLNHSADLNANIVRARLSKKF